jgi:hypothetical protein
LGKEQGVELMSARQWRRWDLLERVERGELTMGEAAQLLGLSVRQLRRVRRRVEREGRRALAHGNRGRPPHNRLDEATRARIATLRQGRYAGFNDVHFAEKLATEVPPVRVSAATVRRVLRAAGIAAVRRRRPPKHRRRRERMAQVGLMLLWDGSRHDWLEGRGPWLTLVGAVDDATGAIMPGAHFATQECAAAYLHVLHAIVATHGRPAAIYMDQHGALKRNDDNWTLAEERRGRQDPTQVGQALEALGIRAIYATSPQAKGRVERLWKTLQDRVVSELRLAGVTTAAAATAVLTQLIPTLNAQFARRPASLRPAWQPVPRGVDLTRVCSLRYEATVLRDNTVRLGGLVIDIPPGPRRRSYADKHVDVCHLLDGTWCIYLGERLLATHAATTTGELRALRQRRKGHGSFAHNPELPVYAELPA